MKRKAAKAWRSVLREDQRALERLSRRPPEEKASSAAEFLADNFYLFHREGRAALQAIPKKAALPMGANGLPRAYELLKKQTGGGILPDFAALSAFCRQAQFNYTELTLVPLLLKTALLAHAAAGAKAGDEETLRAAANSLRAAADIPFEKLFAESSETEKLLLRDKGFACSDERTKALYRRLLGAYARKHERSESEAAQTLLERAEKEGKSLFSFLHPTHRRRGTAMLFTEGLLPLAAAAALGIGLHMPWSIPLLWLPLWGALQGVVNRVFLMGIDPEELPAVELDGVIPKEAATVLAVSALLPTGKALEKMQTHLRDLYLRAGQGAVSVCLLADLKAAESETRPEDDAQLSRAMQMIDALNEEYPGVFSLFVRERVWSPTQGNFIGRERKRGAITALLQAARGDDSAFFVCHGAKETLKNAKYVFALDSDTDLSFDCLCGLVAVAEHPENAPKLDRAHTRVSDGYGIFVPRAATALSSAYKTRFSRWMTGAGGISGYDLRTGERYQDLFGASLFTGKGLIHIDAYNALLPEAFAPETVLSHDIPEGELLRAAFVSDVQITDDFPKTAQSYFDRMSRWVRGDAQNAAFFGKHIETPNGRAQNPFPPLSKYKLFDNLRRAATPVFSWMLCLVSVLLPPLGAAVFLAAAVLAVTAQDLLSLWQILFHGDFRGFSARYYGKTVPAALKTLADALLSLILLPRTAVVNLCALTVGFVRRFLTHKNMLSWVTAAQSEHARSFLYKFLHALPALGSFLWLFLLGGAPARLLSLCFLFEPLFSWISARPYPEESTEIDAYSRQELGSWAASMWKYFAEHCNAQNHFLPPDNVQESPVPRVAHRTSPTNIGLMLCSCLAARDLLLIDTREMDERLLNTLETVGSLPKWHGNLLNWYDTETLAPLAPRYASAVDSGNFLCCLVALKEGLREYPSESETRKRICAVIASLLENAELSALYDKRRKLFYIGYDLDKEVYTNGYYDLLMSESRMMSYYAVASRQVPKKHWGALSRVRKRNGEYTGAVAWSGTMFEYFMPYLFLESRENTLTHESLRYCVYCQRRFARARGIPFGISESGYYRFDAQLNYQYRAHGVPKAALRRSAFNQAVVSPYSSFLCLPFVPRTALKNLKALKNMHAVGEYGFYEAIDFTDLRDPQIVRSFMAHHIGMSLLSVVNALQNNVMQKRFLRDRRMLAGRPLLEEPVPLSPVVFREQEEDALPEHVEKPRPSVYAAQSPSVLSPAAAVYTNGAWTTVLADCGAGHARFGGVHVTRQSRDLLYAAQGVFAVWQGETDVFPLCAVLDRQTDAQYSCTFSEDHAVFSAHLGVCTASTEVRVHPVLPAELRRFTVQNAGKTPLQGRLLVYLEPSLCAARAESAHKAFQKLFVTAETEESGQTAVFIRRTRAGESPLYLGCGFLKRQDFSLALTRETVLRRGEGVFSLLSAELTGRHDRVGAADVCFAASVPLEIPPRGEREVTLFLCCAGTKDTLLERTAMLRREGFPTRAAAQLLPYQKQARLTAQSLLPGLFFARPFSDAHRQALADNLCDVSVLWRFGISGDLPIVTRDFGEAPRFSDLLPYLQTFCALRAAGIACDFVFLLPQGTDAARSLCEQADRLLQSDSRPQLRSAHGSVFFLSADILSGAERCALTAFSAVLLPDDAGVTPAQTEKPVKMSDVQPESTQNGVIAGGYRIAGKPALPWCYILANPSFSTLVGDSTLGASFAVNSRLNKLTRFSNDTMLDNVGERLFLERKGKIYDLLRRASVEFGGERAVYRAVCENLRVCVTVSVPERGMRKDVEVEMENTGDTAQNVRLCLYTEPSLEENGTASPFLQSAYGDGALVICNPTNTAVPGFLRIGTDNAKEVFYTVSKVSFQSGAWDAGGDLPNAYPCAVLGRSLVLPPKRKEKVRFVLSFGRTAQSARAVADLELKNACEQNRIELHSPDAALDAIFNDFAVNQIERGRIFARTGFYQSGGAFGFRDQLQDAGALLLTHPQLMKRQIARCCAAQFEEGDVLHWWHPVPDRDGKVKGVRTRYSDDLLWLPYMLARYVEATGDSAILSVQIAYLAAEELRDGETERYFEAPRGNHKESVLQHAERAVRRALRFGEHGLLLMGSGDWNDSFNTVGAKGRGESVWLSQFAVMVLEAFAVLLESIDRESDAAAYRETAARLRQAIEDTAWEGDRYLRAFYDDGEKMGARTSAECRIDSLTQSFSVFAGLDKTRSRTALQTAYDALVDKENGIVKLFAPAFSGRDKKAGYVAAYPPGIRENGGQYTHAAVWFCRALFEAGLSEQGAAVLALLNPLKKQEDPAMALKYKTEPYYFAGDVYAARGAQGHGGWSLYTGSAGHFYALVVEVFLGLSMHKGRLYFDPHPPESWGDFRFTLHLAGAQIEVEVASVRSGKMLIDGAPAQSLLPDGKNHVVKIL